MNLSTKKLMLSNGHEFLLKMNHGQLLLMEESNKLPTPQRVHKSYVQIYTKHSLYVLELLVHRHKLTKTTLPTFLPLLFKIEVCCNEGP